MFFFNAASSSQFSPLLCNQIRLGGIFLLLIQDDVPIVRLPTLHSLYGTSLPFARNLSLLLSFRAGFLRDLFRSGYLWGFHSPAYSSFLFLVQPY